MDTILATQLSTGSGPKYKRVFQALLGGIRSGQIPQGTRLPPVRNLAHDLGITPGTVARAYQLGIDEGLLVGVVGRGTFVKGAGRHQSAPPANDMAVAVNPGLINMRNGHTVDIGQSTIIRAILAKVAADPTLEIARYMPDASLRPCCELAMNWLRDHGVRGSTEDLVLTHGAHNSVMLAMTATLHGRDPLIATTDLTYPGFRQSAHLCRARMVAVASDDDGILPDALEVLCRRDPPQVLLVSSNVHNPTCIATPPERREAIAALARRYDFQIIEDDVYGMLLPNRPMGYDRLCPERCWHATSLSKCLAAGLRIGFLLCPPGRGAQGLRVMQGMSLSISQPLTSLISRLFSDGIVAEFAPRIAAEYEARTEMAVRILSNWQVRSRPGVNFVWVRHPPGRTASALMAATEAAGIQVAAGDSFSLPGAQPPNAIRLTLSGPGDHAELSHALQCIDTILSNAPETVLT